MAHTATFAAVCEANLQDLVTLSQELMGLSAYPTPFDARWTEGMARSCMVLPQYYARMAYVDGKVCGLIVGSTCPMLFSPAVMGVEETIYVREKTPFRASIAKHMLSGLVTWAFKERNASFIRAGETSEMCPRAVDAFFRSQGFKRSGTLYKRDTL